MLGSREMWREESRASIRIGRLGSKGQESKIQDVRSLVGRATCSVAGKGIVV